MYRMKRVLKPIFYNLYQIINFFLKRDKAIGYIFMLHRVAQINKNGLKPNEYMKVDPVSLDFLISKLKAKHKFDFIRMEDVPNRIKTGTNTPFVVFTMDDGYRDNYTQALPIFKKHNVPFTIFVTTNFPDNKAILWWYALEDLLLQNTVITLSNGKTYCAKERKDKELSFIKIRSEILELDQEKLLDGLNDLFKGYNIDWLSYTRAHSMNWEDICILKNEPLVTIGAHTKNHYNLKKLSNTESVVQEIKDGSSRMLEMTGVKSDIFAYPFGSENEAGQREFDAVSSMSKDFRCAVRSVGGPVTMQNCLNYSLPRIMITPDFRLSDLAAYKEVYTGIMF